MAAASFTMSGRVIHSPSHFAAVLTSPTASAFTLSAVTISAALDRHGLSPAFTLGGANLSFFPVNHLARRSGIVYIRRATQDLPVYRLTLRAYIGQLIGNIIVGITNRLNIIYTYNTRISG